MIKLIHMDPDWNHAVIEKNGQKYLMNPPYKSGRKVNLDTPNKEYLANFKSPDDAQRYMMTLFASHNLHNIMLAWKKYSSAGVGNVTLEKIRDMALKTVESELRKGVFPEKEMKELFALHVGLGVDIDKRGRLSMILKKSREVSPDKIDSFLVKISRVPSPYEERQADILAYVESILEAGTDPQKANYILTSFKMNLDMDLDSVEIIEKFEELLSKCKHQIIQHAKENGESLAKPWQKYINTEPQYMMKGPKAHGDSQEWEKEKEKR